MRLFKKDCDGQDASTNRPTAFYAVGLGGPTGITEAHLHGKPKYYLITVPGEVFQINADGTPIEKVVTVPGDFKFAQIAFDPHFGVLLATAPFCQYSPLVGGNSRRQRGVSAGWRATIM